MRFVDFHVHTTASDGKLSSREVVAEAAKANLAAIGITDHDTMDGVADARRAGRKFRLEVIPGIELSAHYQEKEIHILGYFCDEDNLFLNKKLRRLKLDRYHRMEKMVGKLNSLGIPISLDEVLAKVQGNAIGRPHLAAALCEKGYCQTPRQAFEKYIGFHSPAYVEREKFTPFEAIEVIRRAGGVAVLAHPGIYGELDFLPLLVKAGLMGIEAFHPRNRIQLSYRCVKLASAYGLFITGGSDFHGSNGAEGVRPGSVKVHYSFLQRAKQQKRLLKRRR